jgi:hypothetical protein
MDSTRWPLGGATSNEVVFVPVEFAGVGAADMTPLFSKGTTGALVKSVVWTGVGLYTVNLSEPFPFLFGALLSVFSPTAAFLPLRVNVAADSVVNTDPASVKIQVVLNIAGVDVATNVPPDCTLQGVLIFRNSATEM